MRGSAISRWCQWFRLLQGFKVALSRSHPLFLCHLLPSTMVTGFSFYERRSTMVTRDRGWKDEVDILSRLLCILQSFKAILWYFPSLCLCSYHLWSPLLSVLCLCQRSQVALTSSLPGAFLHFSILISKLFLNLVQALSLPISIGPRSLLHHFRASLFS